MRLLAPAALFTSALLATAAASADDRDPPVPPPTPAVAAPVAPPAAPAPPPVYPAPPWYWVPAPPPITERRSEGMRITGIVLFASGGVVSAVGAVLFFATALTGCPEVLLNDVPQAVPRAGHERVGSARQALNGCDTSPFLGIGLITAGLVTAVVGIPLYVIGARRVPIRQGQGQRLPVVSIGAGNASLRWTF